MNGKLVRYSLPPQKNWLDTQNINQNLVRYSAMSVLISMYTVIDGMLNEH